MHEADLSAYKRRMQETLRSHLLALLNGFDGTKITAATIGKQALNDNTFFSRLIKREGTFNVRTYDRVVAWCRDNWPEDREWPASVPLPERQVA